jgi:ATP-dependent DNA helicase RecG
LITVVRGELARAEIMNAVDLKDRMHFANEYLQPALDADLIEMTIPDKPRSSKQRYRLTDKGRQLVKDTGEKQ